MPRIPVYEQRGGYAVPAVRAPQVERPVVKTPDARWQKWQLIGQGMELGAQVPFVRTALDRAGEAAAGVWKKLFSSGKEAGSDVSQSGSDVSQEAAGNAQTATRAEDVSSGRSLRAGLLQAVQSAEDPLDGLDAYAAQVWNRHFAAQDASSSGAQAFMSDYAVLRRDLSAAQDAQKQATARAAWQEDARQSVRLASLIKTPGALESYLEDASARSRRNASALGLDGESAARELKQNAVQMNVESALAAGDVASAGSVFRALGERLPQNAREVLSGKLQTAQAQALGEQAWREAKCSSEGADAWGEAEKRLDGLPKETRTAALRYARECAQAEERARQRRRSEGFRALRETDGDAASVRRALMGGYAADGKDFKRQAAAAEQWVREPGRASDADAFNRLYAALHDGGGKESDADAAFDAGRLNARDYLLLKENFASRAAGHTDPDAAFVSAAAERLCRRNGLDEKTARAVKYRVFSTPGSADDKARALRRIKELLAD